MRAGLFSFLLYAALLAWKGLLFYSVVASPVTSEDRAMLYANPGSADALFNFKSRYENFIGGEWVAPLEGNYFDNITPVTGEVFCEVPRSTAADLKIDAIIADLAKILD